MIVEGFGAIVNDGLPHAPPLQELVLGQDLAIAGRVIDADGKPLSGWRVALQGTTELSHGRLPVVAAETLGGAGAVITGARGRFRVGGLLERDYALQAWDKDTLLMIKGVAVPAGTDDLELRLAPDALHPRVAGRIVTRAGRPVAQARVRVSAVTYRTESGFSSDTGAETLTDADGRFELADVPRELVYLDLDAENILPERYWFDDGQPVDDLVLSVPARVHFQVEIPADAAAGLL